MATRKRSLNIALLALAGGGAQLYPVVKGALGGDDPIAAMHRTHRELQQIGALLGRIIADLPPAMLDQTLDQILDQTGANDFRRVLYGLKPILRLRIAQEDETYYGVADTESRVAAGRSFLASRSHAAADRHGNAW